MAKPGEEEEEEEVVEYESDPEEEKRMLGRRRREAASDDEEGGEEDKPGMDRMGPIHSDESDCQGGAADYDEEEDDDEDDEEGGIDGFSDEEDEEGLELEEEEGSKQLAEGKEEGRGGGLEGKDKEDGEARKVEEQVEGAVLGNHVEEEEEQEGRQENEPFTVPTAGAFYMHDDRLRHAGGRFRPTNGGKKLWESKDDKKWGHDKFEEMTLQERHYEQGRRGSRGSFRGRGGKSRGADRGYARRNRPKSFSNGNNQTQGPKNVRGRGPRKYESVMKNANQAPSTQNKQPGRPVERASSHGSSGRNLAPTSNQEPDQVPPARKHSSLNSASPPFYPSGSSNKDITLNQKRDIQVGSTSRNLRSPVADERISMQQTNTLMRGKNIADSVSIDKLYIEDSAGKPLNNLQLPSSGSSLVNNMQSPQSRAHGRGGAPPGQMTYQPIAQQNQVSRGSHGGQPLSVQRNATHSRSQPSGQGPVQQMGQRTGPGSQASSPPNTAQSINSYESGEGEATSESSKSKGALVGKAKGNIQGSARGSFLYGGAQVVGATGNMGVGHGDQNFPAFLPVMQFGGQHPGGIGVPAVGMAFPGYVAQPQLGLGNSEMTWLPVLASAAGTLGATYCSPYIAMDGAYHSRPSAQASSAGSSGKENTISKPNNEWKPAQRPELTSDEYGQRQKPRRYSEMDFKQPSTST